MRVMHDPVPVDVDLGAHNLVLNMGHLACAVPRRHPTCKCTRLKQASRAVLHMREMACLTPTSLGEPFITSDNVQGATAPAQQLSSAAARQCRELYSARHEPARAPIRRICRAPSFAELCSRASGHGSLGARAGIRACSSALQPTCRASQGNPHCDALLHAAQDTAGGFVLRVPGALPQSPSGRRTVIYFGVICVALTALQITQRKTQPAHMEEHGVRRRTKSTSNVQQMRSVERSCSAEDTRLV